MATKPKIVKLKDLLSSQIEESLGGFNNGTYGQSFIGKITGSEPVYDSAREKKRQAYLLAKINNLPELEQLEKEYKEMEVIMEFEFTLKKPIPVVLGSSTKTIDDQKKRLQAENVEKIYIRETLEDKIILEELKNEEYKLTLTKTQLEVKAANGINPVTVYVTDILAKDYAALKMVERNLERQEFMNANYR